MRPAWLLFTDCGVGVSSARGGVAGRGGAGPSARWPQCPGPLQVSAPPRPASRVAGPRGYTPTSATASTYSGMEDGGYTQSIRGTTPAEIPVLTVPVTQINNDFYMIQFLDPIGSLVLKVVKAVNRIYNFLWNFFISITDGDTKILLVYLTMSGTGGTIHFNSTCTSAHWPGWDVCHITDRSNMQQISNFQN